MAGEQSRREGTSLFGFLRADPAEALSGPWRERLWKVFIGFWVIYILAPPIMLVLISLDSAAFVRVPQTFSLEKYELMLRSEPLLDALYRSLLLAVITMVIAPLLALLAVLAYRKAKYKTAFIGILILPLFIPGVVQGFSLMIFFQQIGFNNPLVAEIIGHTIWAFPFAFLVLLTSMSTVTEDILLASSDLGANEFETFRYIIYPLIKPGLISAVIFSFVLSFNEFSRTLYLKGRDNTVSTYVWAKLQVELTPEVFALAGLTVVISLVLIGVAIVLLWGSTQAAAAEN